MSEDAPDAQLSLSINPKPAAPRPPMTFEEQAELLEYLHGRATAQGGGTYTLSIQTIDQSQMDDLWLTAQRLRRMTPHEDAIRQLVMGR